MVPPYSHRVSRVRRYSGYSQRSSVFVYGTLTLFGVLSHTLRLTPCLHSAVLTPRIFLLSVWPSPRSLATTSGISVDFFSSPYLDVSVQAVPYVYLCIQYTLTDLHLLGCPIRKSPDQSLLTTPRGLSQLTTSFIGSQCQGIPLALFVA